MTVRFIVDTAADITVAEAKNMGISLIPMTITFNDKEYKDAFELDHKEFFTMLMTEDILPHTSQISPGEFAEAFQKVAKSGDTAVVLTISGKLSGTYQSAVLAAKDFPDKIFIVDSLNATAGQRLLVQYGLMLAQQNMPAADIATELQKTRENIRVLAVVDTLEYLRKGGRISKTVAFAGNILSIKPILALENGEIFMKAKARGTRQANKLLFDMVKNTAGINFDLPAALFYSGSDNSALTKYISENHDFTEEEKMRFQICSVGATIGTHLGPGAIGIAFFKKER